MPGWDFSGFLYDQDRFFPVKENDIWAIITDQLVYEFRVIAATGYLADLCVSQLMRTK